MCSAFVLLLGSLSLKCCVSVRVKPLLCPLEQNHYPSPDKVLGKDTDVSSLLPRVQPSSALGAEVFFFFFAFEEWM